jgi:hypothetical protein
MESVFEQKNTFVGKYISLIREAGEKLHLYDINQLFCGSIDPAISKLKIWRSNQHLEWMSGEIERYVDDDNFMLNIADCKLQDESRVVLAVGGGSEQSCRTAFLSFYNKKKQLKWKCQICVDEMHIDKKWQAASFRLRWDGTAWPHFTSVYMRSVHGYEECEVVCKVNLEKILYSSSRELKRKQIGFLWNEDIVPVWEHAFEQHDKGTFLFYTLDPEFLDMLMEDTLEIEAEISHGED